MSVDGRLGIRFSLGREGRAEQGGDFSPCSVVSMTSRCRARDGRPRAGPWVERREDDSILKREEHE